MQDKRLHHLFASWKDYGLPQEPSKVRQLRGSGRHRVYLLKVGSKRFVAKFYQGNDQRRAIKAHEIAAEFHIAPKIYFVNEEQGVLITDFVETQEKTTLDHQNIDCLAACLKKTHRLQHHELPSFSAKDYASPLLIAQHFEDTSLSTTLAATIKEYADDESANVFSHHDLVRENCLYDGNRWQLIDWEFACQDKACYDLASCILYWQMSDSQEQQFVAAYGGDTISLALLLRAKILVLWIDHIWYRNHPSDRLDAKTKEERFEQLQTLCNEIGS